MPTTHQLTAIIERDDDVYVALCPELDVASQGATIEQAKSNLVEALELFFESADQSEIARRLHPAGFRELHSSGDTTAVTTRGPHLGGRSV